MFDGSRAPCRRPEDKKRSFAFHRGCTQTDYARNTLHLISYFVDSDSLRPNYL